MQFAAQALLLTALLLCLLSCLDDLLCFGSPTFAVDCSGFKVGGVKVSEFEVSNTFLLAKGWASG